MPDPTIIDLHCDLLSYLAQAPEHSPHDPRCRCSLAQLRQGQVALQALAIFSPTQQGSEEFGRAQVRALQKLLHTEEGVLRRLDYGAQLGSGLKGDGEPIWVIAAIENASSFCAEDEPLQVGLDRLGRMVERSGRLLYVSLTWKQENRFGGGNESRQGLHPDGRNLIEWLAERGIPLDLSHASHWLAGDVLELLDAKGIDLPVLASHSNFRAVREIPRNLPDDIAREIIRRDGIIGLNFLRPFLAPESAAGFSANARHALALGGEKNYCLGADFFADVVIPSNQQLDAPLGPYLPNFADASCYPNLFRQLRADGEWPEGFLERMAHGNATRFIQRVLA